jgi:Ca2+-binding RTX toxin-like protein
MDGEAGGSVMGGAGNNTLYGTALNDRLVGGAGNDVLFGGAGADQFVFNSLTGTDVIRDFTSGQDTLVFEGMAFMGLNADSASDRLSVNAQGHLLYDADGDGPDTALHIATLMNNGSPVTTLNANDMQFLFTMPLP